MNPNPDARLSALTRWLQHDLGRRLLRIEVASADASFRRYFRVFESQDGADGVTETSLIAMDAPPDKENIEPYLHVARLLAGTGVHVPAVHAVTLAQGFVLLEDLGSTAYLTSLQSGADPDELYGAALAALADIQVRGRAAAQELPPYDAEVLEREMQLLPEWFCTRHLRLELDAAEQALLRRTFDFLIGEALRQPLVLVHRDYHSRNLMLTAERNPGVIDFQDALRGPLGYDLVSLLKDCYIRWPRERVETWLRAHRAVLAQRGVETGGSEREFLRWFDLIGVQRHIKVLGIFARLWYRDGKPGYLADLPLTLDYVRDACARYVELQEFARWLERRIVPLLAAANARERPRPAAG